MHILIIPSWYKTEENPVGGSFFEEQARGLLKRENKVGIFFPQFTSFSSNKDSSYQEYDDKGLPTLSLNVKAVIPRNRWFNYWYFCRQAHKRFKKYVRKHGRPDILHSHTVYFGGIIAEYLSRKTGIPFIITEHYTPFITGGITNKYDIKKAKQVFRAADQCFVVSTSFREELSQKLDLSSDLFRVIHNMVDPAFFNIEKPSREFKNGAVIFFTTSFLTERKNHKLMFDAFKIFCKKYPDSVFIIGGDGSIREELEKYVAELGMSNNIVFKGLLSRSEVQKEMSRSHIFLLASTYETFGVVLIEALASGRPVITTDSKGPRDIVTEENGIMLTSWEPVAYAEKMIQMVENYKNYDSKRIAEDCFNRFSEETIITKLEKVYKAII